MISSFIKKYLKIFIAIVLIMSMLFQTGVFAAEENNANKKIKNKKTEEKAQAAQMPSIAAGSAIMYCENTGNTLYSLNVSKKYAPYSIAKLMTTLLAVQNLPLDKEVTISKNAASIGESSMDLKVGEKVTVEQLLYGALLNSGNDAAYALGETVSGGDINKFVALMNKTAKNLGCKNTHFANPNGYKSDDNYTTAEDFIKITKVALSNNIIKKITGSKEHNVPPTNKSDERKYTNKLPLLSEPESGVYAGKTGLWGKNDSTVAIAYEKNGLKLYIVLLADDQAQRTNDLKKLIKYAEKSLKGVKVVSANKKIGKVRIIHGEVTRLDTFTKNDGYAYLPKEGSKELISTEPVMNTDVKAPVKNGEVVGYLHILTGEEVVNKVPLVVHQSVNTGWFPSYIGISNNMTVILIVLIILILMFLLWILKQKIRAKRIRKMKRERMLRRKAEEALKREEENRRGRLY